MAERNKIRLSEHNKPVICLTNIHVVRLLAACIVGAYILFCVGYFKGKRVAEASKAISYTTSLSENATMKEHTLTVEDERDAHTIMNQIIHAGLQADLYQKISSDAAGNKVVWYQIITKNFTNQEELVKLVERIRCQEAFVGKVALSEC